MLSVSIDLGSIMWCLDDVITAKKINSNYEACTCRLHKLNVEGLWASVPCCRSLVYCKTTRSPLIGCLQGSASRNFNK